MTFGVPQKLTTSARIELTTSSTHVATWHVAERATLSYVPRVRMSLLSYGGGTFIRAAGPRATSSKLDANAAQMGACVVVNVS